jgi:hypothetical protein
MSTPTIEQCEQVVRDALTEVRGKFQQALTNREPGGNVFSALNKEFHVDQLRRLLANADGAPAEGWTVWLGQRCLSTAKRVDRGTLSLYVGANRFIPVDTAFMAFADIIGGKKLRNWSNVPGVLNLFAIEGTLFPERDMPIWVIAARMLEIGSEEDLHKVLPPLHTEFDPLHQELPPESEPEYRLRPLESANRETWPQYQARLLVQVLPELSDELEKEPRGEDVHLFQKHTSRLQRYVRDQFFARLAAAIESADGGYVVLHGPEE